MTRKGGKNAKVTGRKKNKEEVEERRGKGEEHRIQASLQKLRLASCIKLTNNTQTSQAKSKQGLAAQLHLQANPGVVESQRANGGCALGRGEGTDHDHRQVAIAIVRSGGRGGVREQLEEELSQGQVLMRPNE